MTIRTFTREDGALSGADIDLARAPHWWSLASPDNHGVDIAAWPDFEDHEAG